MKCLSVKQPWVYLICSGIKDVENRSWKPKQAPGRILIHAGAKIDHEGLSWVKENRDVNLPEQFTTGAIVGYVDVYGFTEYSTSE